MGDRRASILAGALLALALGLPAVAGAQPTLSRLSFQQADLDGDGFVDLAEFQKDVVRGFHALDADRDGTVSAEEIAAARPQTAGLRRAVLLILRAHDADGDGQLSFREIVGARVAYFEEADTDRDDRLSLSEVMAYDARMRERAQAARAARAAERRSPQPTPGAAPGQ